MKIYSENFFYKGLLGFDSRTIMKNTVTTSNAYREFDLIVNGKKRRIDAINPKSKLYHLQKKILNNFLINIPLPNCACGFVEGKNYLDFLKPHCNKKYYMRLDIKSFFASIKIEHIKKIFEEYILINDGKKKMQVINDLTELVTLNGSLPQGSVTSPYISNVFFRRIDIRIRNYCRKFNVEYTRYADDMLFSSNEAAVNKAFFTKRISKILKDFDLKLNSNKGLRTENQIVLNGYVVSEKISLSRKKLIKINTLIYAFNKGVQKKKCNGIEEYTYRLRGSKSNLPFELTDDLHINKLKIINYLAGYRSYLMTFSKPNCEDYCFNYHEKIKKIEYILEVLSIEKLAYNEKRSSLAIIVNRVKFGMIDGYNIEVRKISKTYPNHKMVFKNINMELNDRTLYVKFYNTPLNLNEVIQNIEEKAMEKKLLKKYFKEIEYAIKINETYLR